MAVLCTLHKGSLFTRFFNYHTCPNSVRVFQNRVSGYLY